MIDINLAPWREYVKTMERRAQWREAMGAMALALLFLCLFHWFFVSQIKGAKDRLTILQQRLENMNKKMEATRGLPQVIEYQKIPEMNLDFILSHQERILVFLQKIAQRLPSQASLKKISLEKNQWRIEGVAAGIPIILSYVDQLKASFKRIILLDLKQIDGQCYFQLRIEML